MFYYGSKSRRELLTCHPLLIEIAEEAIQEFDLAILEGYRGEKKQNAAFASDKSKVKYPFSKHNKTFEGMPRSEAFDIAPWKWWGKSRKGIIYPKLEISLHNSLAVNKANAIQYSKDLAVWYHFAGCIRTIARRKGIKIRWGGDWDGDYNILDQSFNDLVHWELELEEQGEEEWN